MYGSERDARQLLAQINFPLQRISGVFDGNALTAWGEILRQCELGIAPEERDAEPGDASVRALLLEAFKIYRRSDTFRALVRTYAPEAIGRRPTTRPGPAGPGRPEEAPERPRAPAEDRSRPPGRGREPGPDVDDLPHVIAGVESPEEIRALRDLLASFGLDPAEHWSTSRAASFRINAPDDAELRMRLADHGVNCIIVPAGAPDYLFRVLFVIGPDGRRFRFADTPSHETVEELVASVSEEYSSGAPGGAVIAVMEVVQEDGSGRRLNGPTPLHDAGVRDGDTMRAGFQANAGAVNPLDRQDALARVHRQMRDFDLQNPGIEVEPDATVLPTSYLVRFRQRSFAPPYEVGGEPPETSEHEVEIELGPDFPETAPRVYWLSSIFHPNVFPNYECERARERPVMRGMVCLGMLQESYLPSLDFGDLCSMLIGIAAYRNYSVVQETGAVDTAGRPILRGNYYDGEAAYWATQPPGQQQIIAIGGQPMTAQRAVNALINGPGGPVRLGYRNTVEAVD